MKYVIIHYNIDGCRKQYRFENIMWLLYVLKFAFRVIIDRCINAPGNRRIKIDRINGSEKT